MVSLNCDSNTNYDNHSISLHRVAELLYLVPYSSDNLSACQDALNMNIFCSTL